MAMIVSLVQETDYAMDCLVWPDTYAEVVYQ